MNFSRLAWMSALVPVALIGCASPTDDAEGNSAPNGEETVGTSEDALTGCTVFNYTPWYSGGRVYARSRISCSVTQPKIYANVWLVRNGSIVAENHQYCYNNYTCDLTTSYPNASGDQKWCTMGSAVVGTTGVGGSTVCESASW